MNFRTKAFLVSALVVALAVAGCGGGSQPVVIALSPNAAQSVVAGQSVSITATVSNDKLNKGVTWSLTGPGTLSAQTATSVTYTAPSPIAANATATITATSASDTTKTTTLTINLQAVSIALTPGATQTDEQSQTTPITAAISNDPANKGVTWTLTGAGALSGQTATTVTYTAPASITASSTATVTATSVFDGTKTASLTINLVPPPSVTTTTLPAGTVGVSYTASLAATNGVSPYTWTVTLGALPGGLALSSGGQISGTPTAFGTFNFTVQVKDAHNFTASANLSIKINPAPVSITTTSLPNGIVSASYSANLNATGGAPPITWSVTVGSLPTGLVLDAATGAITGTPTTAGTFSFTVQAADSSTPALTATKALSITIIPVLSITTASLPNGITSTAYSATLASSGGVTPVTWTVTLGTLPAGLTLNATTGAISGTPTTAGTSNFTVQAADSGTPQQKVTKALSITIVQQLVISNNTLPTGAVNSVYSATLQSSGGTPAVTWSISAGTLPAGLTLTANTGAITGTPTTAGTSNFTVQATDSGTPQQIATKALIIVINPVLAITTTSPMPSGTVGTAYSQTLRTNGGGIAPITWSIIVGPLPPGLSLAPSTGVISGTPTASGTFNFTVQAADSGTPQQTDSKALSISVATAPLSVATTGLPDGVVGQAYTGATLQSAGGNPPVTWSISVGSLPAGLTLNTTTGAITGTPTTAATTTFTVKATDSTTPTAQTATKSLSIRVNAVLTITTTLPGGTVNSPYNATLAASGGATPITWSITVGSLPAGLTLNASTGMISGTPTASGTSSFTVQATDSTSPTAQTATANLSITVTVAPLVITTTSLPNGVVTSVYNQTIMFTGGTNPVTWSITAGALPAGLVLNTANGNITGTPTTAGTSTFTVKATDSATPTAQTATANLSITVNSAACGTGSESLLNGQYAFALQGFNGTNPVGIGGIFDADGLGNIAKSVGIVDINDGGPSGVQLNQAITSAGSSYSIGPDHRGCMTIITGAVSRTFRFSLGNLLTTGVASTGHVIQFDSSGEFVAGTLRIQNPAGFSNAAINGNYAFGATAPKANSGKFAVLGTFTAAGGVISAGQADTNDNGNVDNLGAAFTYPPTPVAFTGSYTIAANGRGTFTITVTSGGTPVATVHASLYVVSASEMLMLSTDPQTTNSLFVGSALQTTQSTFGASSLNAPSILYTTGLQNNGGTTASRVSAGIFSPNSSGSFTFSGNTNKGGTIGADNVSGSYSVASNGRVTFSVAGAGANNLPIIYLVSPNKGFVIFTDSGLTNPHVEFGLFEPQTGGPFTNASASGTYAFGTVWPSEINVGDDEGVATFASPNVTGTSDSISSGSSNPNNAFSGTFSIDSTGLGVIPANCSISGGTCQTIFFVISPTKAVVFDVKTTNTNPNLQVADK